MTTPFTMRRPALLGRLLGLGLGLLSLQAQAQFTQNNVVVVQAGSTASANAVTLQEYSSTAAVGSAIALPSTTGSRLTVLSSTLEGNLIRSEDRKSLTIGGYDVATGGTISTSTSASTTPRSVATILADKSVSVLGGISALFPTGNHRGAVTDGQGGFYSSTSARGIQYYTAPGSSVQITPTTGATNIRSIGIYDGRVYFSSGSAALNGIGVAGFVNPTTANQTTSTVVASPVNVAGSPGPPVVTANTANPAGFILVNQDATEPGNDVLYFVDQRTGVGAGGGLYKYSKISGTWTAKGFIATTVGLNHLTARVTATGVELYATSGSSLFTLNDNSGYTGSLTGIFPATALATAAAGTTFRGVAFAPVPANAALTITAGTFSTTAQGSTSASTNFTLTNSSGTDQEVTLQANGPFTYTGTNPIPVLKNSSKTVVLTFAPTATNSVPGSNKGQLLAFTADQAAVTSSFTGEVGTPTSFPNIAIKQGSTTYANNVDTYDFSGTTVNGQSSAPVTFTITNSSTTDILSVTGVANTTQFQAFAADGTTPLTTPFTVPKNNGTTDGTFTFTVVFKPSSTANPRTGTVTFTTNAVSPDNSYVLKLSGTAIDPSLTVGGGATADNQTRSGFFNNVTIKDKGTLTLNGNLTVSGALVIEAGGTLNVKSSGATPTCFVIQGAGTFTLSAGGTLNICDPAGITLLATGPGAVQTGSIRNTTAPRSFATDANYGYNGLAAQSTGAGLPATVRGLTVNNPNGVTLSQATAVAQVARITAGTLTSNGLLTLLSNPDATIGTALLDDQASTVNAGGSVVGNVNVQRAITSATEGYHHVSAPTGTATISDLGSGAVVNNAYNSAAEPRTVTPFPTVYSYDQSRVSPATAGTFLFSFDKGFQSPGSAADAMAVGRGFTANLVPTTLGFTGPVNNGTYALSMTGSGTDPQAGYNLVGNPYPAPLDLKGVSIGGGAERSIYVYVPNGKYSGTYRTIKRDANGTSTFIASGTPTNTSSASIVALGQAMFLRVEPGPAGAAQTGTLTLTNADRVTSFAAADGTFARGTADTRPLLVLTLSNAAATRADQTAVYFSAESISGVNGADDARKLTNSGNAANLSTLAEGRELAINGQPLLVAGQARVVPVGGLVPTLGAYTLAADQLVNFEAGTTVALRDALTGARTLLTAGARYAFSTSTYSLSGRFTLEFNGTGALATTARQTLAALVRVYPNPANGQFHLSLPVSGKSAAVALVNSLGQTVLTRTLRTAEVDFNTRGLAAGLYTLRLTVDGTTVARKLVVE